MQDLRIILIVLMLPFLAFSQYEEYDWEDRDSWMPVQRIFELAEVKPEDSIADIGCHEGYLSIHLANVVGEKGRIYAVDVRQDRLDQLESHLLERELDNVSVILGDYDDPKLPEGKLDVVFIVDTYHEMTDHKDILKHVYKALKPGGRLVILEKLKKRIRNASRDEQTDAHSISAKYVRKELKAAHFFISEEINDLGDWQNDEDKPMWMLVAIKKDDSKWKSKRL